MTFAATMVNPSRMNTLVQALSGKWGMRIARKALARDLRDIAIKAESL
ncbi:hypothetical protein GCM10027404_08920 [Arthrobacter tumbae]|nr:hypothetical protein [Arthrobacter tumbae]MBM7782174.1 hypothetical protein [Arthrobacter tumbae]